MDTLSDPKGDRNVKSVKPPPHRPLPINIMYPDKLKNKPDWKILKDHLQKEGRIDKQSFLRLIADFNKIIKNEGNLLFVQDPVTVVGDIHGQYYDLLKILEIGGNVENTKYLFLGDFVDRGSFSIEINYPSTIYFLRGNHECRQLTSFFNFRDECRYKYDQEIYDVLMDSFDNLPLSCVVNGKFLALHGGISPDLKTLEDIKRLDRFKEPPRQGIFCDILWADPVDNNDGYSDQVYKNNEVRGCSYFYGQKAVTHFLESNRLLSVIRAHEAQLDGYKMYKWNGVSDFPVVITIFSAPNYCDVYNNKGAIIKFENNTLNIQQFNYTAHPYLLPNFMDIFTWSIPFVAEKVTEVLYNVINPEGENQSDDEDITPEDIEKFKQIKNTESGTPTNDGSKLDLVRNKIKFISKMMKMQKILRQENENIVKLKGACPDNKIPKGLLSQGSEAMKDALNVFERAKSLDVVNDKIPDIVVPQLGNMSKKSVMNQKQKASQK